MERLTEYHCGVAVIRNKDRLSEAMSRLAVYEDIGLDPVQVGKLVELRTAKVPVLHMNERSIVFVDYEDGHGEAQEQRNNWWRCPNCSAIVGERVILRGRNHDQRKRRSCEKCGQKIRWWANEVQGI